MTGGQWVLVAVLATAIAGAINHSRGGKNWEVINAGLIILVLSEVVVYAFMEVGR